MPSITAKTTAGADAGAVSVDERIFAIEPNVPVMHQVVTAQLAARRAGTQSTKTRAEVSGGGAKPWKQKGTGRARAGSTRAPHWRGGGVALGPKPRDYSQRTPKKMIRLALRSALSDRFAEGKVLVVDSWNFDAPRTKDAIAALDALGIEGRALLVLPGDDVVTWKSFRNLPSVHLLEAGQLNAYDVLVADVVVFTKDTLPSGGDEAPARAHKPASAATAAAPVRAVKAAPAPTPSSDPAPEGDDMADDLPARQKSDAAPTKPVEATERVKASGEKTDPRFEAARQKADKEDKLREAMGTKDAAPAGSDASPVAEDGDDTGEGSGFSFNRTGDS
jgi:large subunit ribosomal protein L4